MSNIDRQTFPRWTLIAAAALMSASIAGAAVARQQRLHTPQLQHATLLSHRDLTFADTTAGTVQVRDNTTGALIFTAEAGTNGFIRGVMRGLARDRRSRGVGDAPPFRLAEWSDGSLSLQDLSTGKQIELSAFGADNRAAFQHLLEVGESRT